MDTSDAGTLSQDGSYTRSSSPARLNGADYVVGILLLLVVVFLWTASNFVTQVRTSFFWTFVGGGTDKQAPENEALFQGGYEKPFLRVDRI